MNILFLTPRLPLPADTGAKIRTYNLLKNISRNNTVTLLSFYFEENEKAVNQLKNLGITVHLVKAKEGLNSFSLLSSRPIAIGKYRSEKMISQLRELLAKNHFDAAHFDHLHMGQYREYSGNIPSVLDEHNVESTILSRCAFIEKNLAKKVLFNNQARKMSIYEGLLARQFSRCLTVSDIDKDSLAKLFGRNAKIEVIPNGVDTQYFIPPAASRKPPEQDTLVFTGSMDWLPNSDAVIYFCKEILPLVWEKKNQLTFSVVGKNPSKGLLRLAEQDKRIIVTGLVNDVRPYIAKSKVFVVPLRIGGGTRLKILEAMAMEKAVVSTAIGAEGIACTDNKDIIIKKNPKELADAICMVCDDPAKREALGKAGRELVCKQYDWAIIANKLNRVYTEVVNAAN